MTEATSQLCQACGLCCDGSLFPTVRLQPADSAQELKALGFRIQHKKRYDFFDQPCVAFKNNCCSVYEARPVRCRVFECEQLKRFSSGEVTETSVLEKINEAHRMIAMIKKLLYSLGPTNPKKPLLQQYQQIVSIPVDASAEKKVVEERALLNETLLNLNAFFNQEFRSA